MPETLRRRRLIEELIRERPIATQGQLVRLLRRRGADCTQASISRDIAALGLVKTGGRYALPNGAPPPGDPAPRLAALIRHVRPAGHNLIVVVTSVGEASATALAIDSARWPESAGTVAGDDTLFIACDGRAAQKKLLARLAAIAPDSTP
jgi:transcriptional regulator of arginine metabolism